MPRSKAPLRVVATEPETAAPVVDIYAPWRAEIKARDWARCHVAGDRRAPLPLCDARHRTRDSRSIIVRSQGGLA